MNIYISVFMPLSCLSHSCIYDTSVPTKINEQECSLARKRHGNGIILPGFESVSWIWVLSEPFVHDWRAMQQSSIIILFGAIHKGQNREKLIPLPPLSVRIHHKFRKMPCFCAIKCECPHWTNRPGLRTSFMDGLKHYFLIWLTGQKISELLSDS